MCTGGNLVALRREHTNMPSFLRLRHHHHRISMTTPSHYALLHHAVIIIGFVVSSPSCRKTDRLLLIRQAPSSPRRLECPQILDKRKSLPIVSGLAKIAIRLCWALLGSTIDDSHYRESLTMENPLFHQTTNNSKDLPSESPISVRVTFLIPSQK